MFAATMVGTIVTNTSQPYKSTCWRSDKMESFWSACGSKVVWRPATAIFLDRWPRLLYRSLAEMEHRISLTGTLGRFTFNSKCILRPFEAAASSLLFYSLGSTSNLDESSLRGALLWYPLCEGFEVVTLQFWTRKQWTNKHKI